MRTPEERREFTRLLQDEEARPPVSGEPPHEHRWAGPDNFAPYEYCSLCSVPRHHQHHVHEQRRVTDCAECVAAATDFLRPPVSGEPSDEHEHDWVDAPDDETGWYCPTCGVTEYPSDEHEQLANDLYCVAARPETIWWDDLPPEVQKGWIRAADLVKQRVDAARAEGALHGFREGAAQGTGPEGAEPPTSGEPHGESGRGDGSAKGADVTPAQAVISLPGPSPTMTREEGPSRCRCGRLADLGPFQCMKHPLETPDPIRAAYDRGEMPQQYPCPCCTNYSPDGCAAVVITEQTGNCVVIDCQCHGSRADGGLCEDCYVATK